MIAAGDPVASPMVTAPTFTMSSKGSRVQIRYMGFAVSNAWPEVPEGNQDWALPDTSLAAARKEAPSYAPALSRACEDVARERQKRTTKPVYAV